MINLIKQLREETGASLGDIRMALEEAGGDAARARSVLTERVGRSAAKKRNRTVSAGVIDAYIHANGKIGVLVELQCETDFVARNQEFRRLAHEIALHIAAMNPESHDMLLEQEFIRDPSSRVRDLVEQAIGKFGENIKIGNFSRLEL